MIFFSLFLLLIPGAWTPAPQVRVGPGVADSVTVRRPPDAVLEAYRNDPDYQYATRTIQAETWWDEVKSWFFRKMAELFDDTGQASYLRYLMYAVVIGLVVFAVLQVFRMDTSRLFSRSRRQPQGMYAGISEALHDNDFLELARQAVAREHYREAARMYYMHVLRVLDAGGHIKWMPQKTNRDYVTECRQTDLEPAFVRLTYLFDYSWYGHFPVDSLIVEEMRTLSESIENRAGVMS